MSADRLAILLEKYASGTTSGQEKDELFSFLRDEDNAERARTTLKAIAENTPSPEVVDHAHWERVFDSVVQKVHEHDRRVSESFEATVGTLDSRVVNIRRRIVRWVAAAIVIFSVGGGLFYLTRSGNSSSTNPVAQAPTHDALPGRSGAILTLASGKKVLLDSLANGLVATQGQTRVSIQNGQLVYDATSIELAAPVSYNTMTTPRGRQFQLILPDGSRVWLNAASSITYPTAFTGNERKVSITGEAYFEVKHSDRQSFQVEVNGIEVSDIGTHFDIDGYSDDQVTRVTLLEGSVKVSASATSSDKTAQSRVLSPGQQAYVQEGSGVIHRSSDVELDQVMAWKNGSFIFDKANLDVVLRQLSRWYDVEVEYQGNKVPDIKIWGEMKRDLTLSQVLSGLGKIGVNFEIEGKKLIVK